MPIVGTEQKVLSDVVKHEYAGLAGFCRKVVSFKNASGTTLKFGTVLGKRLVNGAAVAVADAGNTGDGTMGAITVGSTAKRGNYILTITSEASDAGGFKVTGPDGELVGTGTVAAAFSGGGLSFTLADGAEDFDIGDTFVITVTGNEEYDVATVTATDGTAAVAGVFIGTPDGKFGYDVVAGAATAVNIIILAHGPAGVGKEELVLHTSFDTAAEKAMAYAGLEKLGIAVLEQA